MILSAICVIAFAGNSFASNDLTKSNFCFEQLELQDVQDLSLDNKVKPVISKTSRDKCMNIFYARRSEAQKSGMSLQAANNEGAAAYVACYDDAVAQQYPHLSKNITSEG